MIAVVLNAILGGLWRRWLGGWPVGPRSRTLRLAVGLPLSWPYWFALDWPIALVSTAASMLFFIPGHRLNHWTVVWRYGPLGLVFPLLKRVWPPGWTVGSFIDGAYSVGELVLGGVFWGVVALVL